MRIWAAVLGTAVASAAPAVTPGSFAGLTSQQSEGPAVQFRVNGDQITGFRISWVAVCVGRQLLSAATTQGSARITIRGGKWRTSSRYRAKLPFGTGVVGHFHVLTNAGRFIDRSHARGAFRLRVVLYLDGRRNDHCDTGRITWTAARKRS